MSNANHWLGTFKTPVGEAFVTVDGAGVLKTFHFRRVGADLRRDDKAVAAVRDQADAYFAGERRAFDLPLEPDGTPFQRKVWDMLLTIPFGRVTSYGALAELIGHAGASRAVGAANGQNPISLVIPCHRVVGSDGRLTGYGGGLPVKAKLLAHEGILPSGLVPGASARTRVDAETLL